MAACVAYRDVSSQQLNLTCLLKKQGKSSSYIIDGVNIFYLCIFISIFDINLSRESSDVFSLPVSPSSSFQKGDSSYKSGKSYF